MRRATSSTFLSMILLVLRPFFDAVRFDTSRKRRFECSDLGGCDLSGFGWFIARAPPF
jgi:hypothetical protein